MLQLLLGLVDPLTGRVSRFKGPPALLVLNTRSVGWLPTALTNCGDAGPLAAALLGIAMGRAFDPRLCPILRGRLYLERIDHVSLVTLSPFLERNRRCSRIYGRHANGDQFFDPGANLDLWITVLFWWQDVKTFVLTQPREDAKHVKSVVPPSRA